MAWKEFEYSYLSSRNDLGYRPYLKVRVTIGDEFLTLYAIVDSGCQDTIINAELAPIFKVDLGRPSTRIGGLGGDGRPGYEVRGVLEFPDLNNVKIQSPLIFSDFEADMLLGQNNFFRNFRVLFDGREGKFKLNKIKNYKDER